jgi:hypothetical protein
VVLRSDDPILVDLTARPRRFLVRGLRQWGGPVTTTDALAAFVGLEGAAALADDLDRLGRAIDRGEALTPRDWMRAVLLAGMVVANREVGAPQDWHTLTGQDLEEAWDDLASVERLLRARFVADPPRTSIFSGEHEGRRTRVWTFAPTDGLGSRPWEDHVAAAVVGPAGRRYRERHGASAQRRADLGVGERRRTWSGVAATGGWGPSATMTCSVRTGRAGKSLTSSAVTRWGPSTSTVPGHTVMVTSGVPTGPVGGTQPPTGRSSRTSSLSRIEALAAALWSRQAGHGAT